MKTTISPKAKAQAMLWLSKGMKALEGKNAREQRPEDGFVPIVKMNSGTIVCSPVFCLWIGFNEGNANQAYRQFVARGIDKSPDPLDSMAALLDLPTKTLQQISHHSTKLDCAAILDLIRENKI